MISIDIGYSGLIPVPYRYRSLMDPCNESRWHCEIRLVPRGSGIYALIVVSVSIIKWYPWEEYRKYFGCRLGFFSLFVRVPHGGQTNVDVTPKRWSIRKASLALRLVAPGPDGTCAGREHATRLTTSLAVKACRANHRLGRAQAAQHPQKAKGARHQTARPCTCKRAIRPTGA